MPDTPADYSLLDDIEAYIRKFVVLSEEAAVACTLWVAHTHAIQAAYVTPYLHIISADRQSGKTTLYDVIGRVAARSWQTAHTTAAAVRRGLDDDPPPTLMIDEVETIFVKNGDDFMRGVLDAGFKRGAMVTVLERPNWVMRQCKVFGPKVLAGLGLLPDTVESRSIPIHMRPKRSDEHVERARERTLDAWSQPLKTRLNVWQAEAVPLLGEVEVKLPDFLNSRQQDFWEPLLAIADLFQQSWPERAVIAASLLHTGHEDDSEGLELLRNIRDLFTELAVESMYSDEMVSHLLANEELRWHHVEFHGRDYELTTWHMARILRAYDIRPVRLRLYLSDDKQARGYRRADFEDAWSRHL